MPTDDPTTNGFFAWIATFRAAEGREPTAEEAYQAGVGYGVELMGAMSGKPGE